MERLMSDHRSVCSTLRKLMPSLELHHIKDCLCLGKYSDSLRRPRPLLVKLNCICDVADILSRRTSLPASSNVYIKPHLSQAQKHTESLLLKERRLLIDAGTDRRAIRMSAGTIYIGDRPHAWQGHRWCVGQRSYSR